MFTISELIKATAADFIQPGTEKLVKDVCIDSRDIKPGDCFIAIKGNNFDGHEFIAQAIQKGAVCVVRTQGSRLRTKKYKSAAVLEVGDTIKALGNIAAFHRRRFNIPVIAVTGSNGKTTTKEMIAYVLSGKFRVLKNEGTKNNHIGVPMTLLGLKNSHDIAVLELGTNHFGEIKELAGICQPNIAVITNIASSHLEFLKDLSGVFAEKCSLLRFLRKPAIAILNADDGFLFKLINSRTSGFSSVSFGVNSPADFRGSAVELRGRACEELRSAQCPQCPFGYSRSQDLWFGAKGNCFPAFFF
ncbi:MAG: UDP-N-acetylmuramoyl-tripeptide--D-alanyl-D-alanine ligase [Candidatus Omnitrophica bacterium]|nr:UDP-N-acetylmuramoyl-tripeptide--D-alanyl-D-alanine ligase [Candidatus Omnitrophota bacterium]